MKQAEFEHQKENGQWVDCFDKEGRCKRPQRPKQKGGKKSGLLNAKNTADEKLADYFNEDEIIDRNGNIVSNWDTLYTVSEELKDKIDLELADYPEDYKYLPDYVKDFYTDWEDLTAGNVDEFYINNLENSINYVNENLNYINTENLTENKYYKKYINVSRSLGSKRL